MDLNQQDNSDLQYKQLGSDTDPAISTGGEEKTESSSLCFKTKKFWKILTAIIISLTIIISITFLLIGSARSVGKVLHLSDLHYDPIYNSNALNHRHCACNFVDEEKKNNCTAPTSVQYGRVGCDAPLSLIETALASAKANLPNPDFIVLTGDIIRHHSEVLGGSLPGRLVNLFQIISNLISTYFTPTISVGQSFGNDDFQKNYFFNTTEECNQPLLKAVLPIFQRMIPPLTHADKNSFHCGGYYSFHINSKLSIIVLNTILYSVRHNPIIITKSNEADPMGQFKWLENTLNNLQTSGNGKSVWIVGHIAPGYESFDMQPMWDNDYTIKYVNIIKKYNKMIKAQFFGHEHLNTFRLFEEDSKILAPIIISSSISPIFCNAPQYRIIEYDTHTFEILDFISYRANVGSGTWTENFRFSKEFNMYNGLSNYAMKTFTTTMRKDDSLFQKYRIRKADNVEMPYPKCGTSMPPPAKNKELCAIEHLERGEYEKCLVVGG